MNVIKTQVEPTTVWMSDHCKVALGGCTKVTRGLVVEVVGVQDAAICGGAEVLVRCTQPRCYTDDILKLYFMCFHRYSTTVSVEAHEI